MACHKVSHFNSRLSYLILPEIAVGYRKLRGVKEIQVNLSVLLENPLIHRRTLNTESLGN